MSLPGLLIVTLLLSVTLCNFLYCLMLRQQIYTLGQKILPVLYELSGKKRYTTRKAKYNGSPIPAQDLQPPEEW